MSYRGTPAFQSKQKVATQECSKRQETKKKKIEYKNSSEASLGLSPARQSGNTNQNDNENRRNKNGRVRQRR